MKWHNFVHGLGIFSIIVGIVTFVVAFLMMETGPANYLLFATAAGGIINGALLAAFGEIGSYIFDIRNSLVEEEVYEDEDDDEKDELEGLI